MQLELDATELELDARCRVRFYAQELTIAGTPITDGRETAETTSDRTWLVSK